MRHVNLLSLICIIIGFAYDGFALAEGGSEETPPHHTRSLLFFPILPPSKPFSIFSKPRPEKDDSESPPEKEHGGFVAHVGNVLQGGSIGIEIRPLAPLQGILDHAKKILPGHGVVGRPSHEKPEHQTETGYQGPHGQRPDYEKPHPERPGYDRPHPERPGYEKPHTGRPGYERPHPDPHPEKPGYERPHPEKPGYEGPHPERPGYERPHPERPGYDRPYPGRPGYERPHPARPGYDRPQPERPGYEKPHPVRPGYERPHPERPGHEKPVDESESGYERPHGQRPGHGRPYPQRPGQGRPNKPDDDDDDSEHPGYDEKPGHIPSKPVPDKDSPGHVVPDKEKDHEPITEGEEESLPSWDDIGEESDYGDAHLQPRRKRPKRFIDSKIYHVKLPLFVSNGRAEKVRIIKG